MRRSACSTPSCARAWSRCGPGRSRSTSTRPRRAYADCLERVRGHARWLACLDIDEFLFAPGRTGLLPALAEFAEHAGVVVHWQVYGSAGELHRRPEPVIRRFQHRAATDWIRNRRVKSIVDPERALHPVDCHHFAFRDGERAVTERGTPVDLVRRGPFKKRLRPLYPLLGPALLRVDPYAATRITDRRVSVDRLRINHYPVKSRQEFEHKARFKREKKRYQGVDYFAYHDRNEVHDPILVDVLPALEKELAALGGERGPED